MQQLQRRTTRQQKLMRLHCCQAEEETTPAKRKGGGKKGAPAKRYEDGRRRHSTQYVYGARSSAAKTRRCGECEGCNREDCGKCSACVDKPKFGGRGAKKQVSCRTLPAKPLAAKENRCPHHRGAVNDSGHSFLETQRWCRIGSRFLVLSHSLLLYSTNTPHFISGCLFRVFSVS